MTETQRLPADTERQQIIRRLLDPVPSVSPACFYDLTGSRLFEVITVLDEYYPTVTEHAILRRHAPEIATAARAAGDIDVLVEPGAGSCEKVRHLLPLLQPGHYAALDVSSAFLEAALQPLRRDFPEIAMSGIAADIVHPLPSLPAGRRLWFYPGSSIGNFTPDEARELLSRWRTHEHGAGDSVLLIGIDLVKDAAVLNAAYDDALGVTAAFNLNVLRHLNRLIGSDFSPRQWEHVAFFNATASRIEMHLRAREALAVRWQPPAGSGLPDGRRFEAGDMIHTENSYKYTLDGAAALLTSAGFGRVRHWTDERGWFGVFLATGRRTDG